MRSMWRLAGNGPCTTSDSPISSRRLRRVPAARTRRTRSRRRGGFERSALHQALSGRCRAAHLLPPAGVVLRPGNRVERMHRQRSAFQRRILLVGGVRVQLAGRRPAVDVRVSRSAGSAGGGGPAPSRTGVETANALPAAITSRRIASAPSNASPAATIVPVCPTLPSAARPKAD
jgi:hypothetical protein